MIINLDPQFIEAARKIDREDFLHVNDWNEISTDYAKKVTGIVCRLGHRLTADRLGLFPQLRWVATVTTGLDHIDLPYCEKKGIRVLSLAGERAFLDQIRATPEHTWGLLLSLIRHVPAAAHAAAQGQWERKKFFGRELYGKTLGIIGLGRVGTLLKKYAEAFDMQVLATDPITAPQTSLEDLLKKSDVVALCASVHPAHPETILGPLEFSQMKRGAIFINTARGSLIDESALLSHLKNGSLAGAALDVLRAETDGSNSLNASHPLIAYARDHQNLILTPHIAGSTHESMEKTATFIAEKILRTLSTEARA